MSNPFDRLVGKTVVSVRVDRRTTNWRGKVTDDEPFLDIVFSGGSKCTVEAQYGGYTGESEDEYPRYLTIHWEAGDE